MSPWAKPILSRDRNQWFCCLNSGVAPRVEPLYRIGVEGSEHVFAVRTS